MSKSTVIAIETPERFKKAIRELWGGPLDKLSIQIGRSRAYMSQAFTLGRIQKSSFMLLANELGVTQEKLLEYAVKPKEQEEPKEEKPQYDVMDMLSLIYEMEKKQTEALKHLSMMFERTWCR